MSDAMSIQIDLNSAEISEIDVLAHNLGMKRVSASDYHLWLSHVNFNRTYAYVLSSFLADINSAVTDWLDIHWPWANQ